MGPAPPSVATTNAEDIDLDGGLNTYSTIRRHLRSLNQLAVVVSPPLRAIQRVTMCI